MLAKILDFGAMPTFLPTKSRVVLISGSKVRKTAMKEDVEKRATASEWGVLSSGGRPSRGHGKTAALVVTTTGGISPDFILERLSYVYLF